MYIVTLYYEETLQCTKMHEENIWLDSAGNSAFMKNIYTNFAKDMYRYGLSLCADECLVEDAIHDLMIDLTLHKDNLLNVRNRKVYILQAMRYHLLLLQKKNSVYEDFEAESASCEVEPDVEHFYIVREEVEERRRLVKRMLSRLNPHQQEVLHLRFTEALPFDEIATIMGMKQQSVQNLFQRAINKLRKEFVKQ